MINHMLVLRVQMAQVIQVTTSPVDELDGLCVEGGSVAVVGGEAELRIDGAVTGVSPHNSRAGTL